MKLAGQEDSTIKKIGRWLSDAFLDYIRAHLAAFSTDVATRMVNTTDHFRNIPYDRSTIPFTGPVDDPIDNLSHLLHEFHFHWWL